MALGWAGWLVDGLAGDAAGWAGRLLDGLAGDAASWGGAGCWPGGRLLAIGWLGGFGVSGFRGRRSCPIRRSRLLGRQGLCLLSCIPF